ncbi:hypothetical protein NPIL_41181 [Nephila pilipes]|uniref:Uncharacterized protein n=1 Tax=Nephila pilipes TaxID=299642 RepID=A0A8X6T6E7_NEPPI|nr:hypothetical protein NPIL_41181 [Nephila pilipes]
MVGISEISETPLPTGRIPASTISLLSLQCKVRHNYSEKHFTAAAIAAAYAAVPSNATSPHFAGAKAALPKYAAKAVAKRRAFRHFFGWQGIRWRLAQRRPKHTMAAVAAQVLH